MKDFSASHVLHATVKEHKKLGGSVVRTVDVN